MHKTFYLNVGAGRSIFLRYWEKRVITTIVLGKNFLCSAWWQYDFIYALHEAADDGDVFTGLQCPSCPDNDDDDDDDDDFDDDDDYEYDDYDDDDEDDFTG